MKEIKLSEKGKETFGLDFAKCKFLFYKWHRDNPSLIVIERINQFNKKIKNKEYYHKDYFILKNLVK